MLWISNYPQFFCVDIVDYQAYFGSTNKDIDVSNGVATNDKILFV